MSRLHRRAIGELFSLLRGYSDVVMFSSFVLCHWSDNLILTTSLCIMNNWQHSQQCTNLQVSQFWNIWHFSVARMKSTKSTSTFWITATSTQSGDQRNYTSPKNVKFEHNSCRPVGVHVARYICISNASVKSCTRTLLGGYGYGSKSQYRYSLWYWLSQDIKWLLVQQTNSSVRIDRTTLYSSKASIEGLKLIFVLFKAPPVQAKSSMSFIDQNIFFEVGHKTKWYVWQWRIYTHTFR